LTWGTSKLLKKVSEEQIIEITNMRVIGEKEVFSYTFLYSKTGAK